MLEGQAEIAERLIRLEPEGAAHRMLLGHRIGLDGQAREQQAAHFGKMFQGIRVVRFTRPAHPQRVLVELDALGDDVAEHHRAKAAVAERQGLVPFAGRVRIKKDVGRALLRACICASVTIRNAAMAAGSVSTWLDGRP